MELGTAVFAPLSSGASHSKWPTRGFRLDVFDVLVSAARTWSHASMSLGRTASSRPARREAPAPANCRAGSRGQHQEGHSAQIPKSQIKFGDRKLSFHRRGKIFKRNYIQYDMTSTYEPSTSLRLKSVSAESISSSYEDISMC